MYVQVVRRVDFKSYHHTHMHTHTLALCDGMEMLTGLSGNHFAIYICMCT